MSWRALLLAWRLVSADGPEVAEAECSDHWTEEGDGWFECVVALETYRCERQGWCSPAADVPLMPPPDPEHPDRTFTTNHGRTYR